jgi:two-component system, cell cycle sensor histidine kinase and response regulator CckA
MDGDEQPQNASFADFVLEHLADAVYWICRDGSLRYVNQAACTMLGYTREQLLAKTMFDVNPAMDPNRWSTVWQALIEQGHRSFQSAHRTSQGTMLTVDVAAHMLKLDGEHYSCAIARDVSRIRPIEEARQREHTFVESLIETAPVIVLLLDGDGNILRFNRSTEQITGYGLAEVRGKNWLRCVVPEGERPKVERLLRLSFAGEPMRGTVYRVAAKSGALRDVVWHDQLVSRADAGGMGLLAIGQDVTGQRDLEQRLLQAEKMEAIGHLAGGIAHDFNNQLTGIMGWTEILSLEIEQHPQLSEPVQRIMLAAKRARDLTAQLLAYSRKGRYVSKNVDLHEIVREVATVLGSGLDKRIAIAMELSAPRPHAVGDPTLLSSAVLNLGLNARDAMPDGGTLSFATRQVTISAAEADGPEGLVPGEFVELLVKDTGIGMDEPTQRRIFEPFFTTKGEGRGVGMGLPAVYGTVKSHHGSIAVESRIGAGTTMRLLLPLGPGAPEDDSGADEVPSREILRDAAALPLHVMVVDDEAPVREVAARMLRRLGCQVVTFASGFEAIDHVSQASHSVDLTVLDMIMPMLDGKATFHALRKLRPDLPVILISGYSIEGAAQGLLDEGAVRFVQKPFTLTALRTAVARLCPSDAKV